MKRQSAAHENNLPPEQPTLPSQSRDQRLEGQLILAHNTLPKEPLAFKRAPSECSIVAFDLDGTLLNPDGSIPIEAPNVISGLQARGIQVVLASGRPMFSVASIAHQLGISPGPLVALNGAHIRHADKSEGFQSIGSILDWEAGIAQTIAAGFVVNLYTASHWLNSDHKHKATQHEIAQMGRLPDGTISERNLPPSEQILKLFVQKENIQTEVLPWRPSGLHCYRSGNSVDLVAFEQTDLGYEPVSKRHGLSKILGNTTALSSVLAFGDGDNDAQMLAHVGYGVTMKNGDERAIESADHVIEPGPNSILRFLTETFGL